MGLRSAISKEPFPDVAAVIERPISAAWFRPKEWGAHAVHSFPPSTITDPDAHFITNNLQPGDAVYGISPDRHVATVVATLSETQLQINYPFGNGGPDFVYKAGHGSLHTLKSLGFIIGRRAAHAISFKHAKIWTKVPPKDFDPDEEGDVYVISHDVGKARWLDGGWTLDDLGTIEEWAAANPGQPLPDYPPGLEPGGAGRAQIVAKYGSLGDYHDANPPG